MMKRLFSYAHDKNDVPIYYGDVVRESNYTFPVTWCKCCKFRYHDRLSYEIVKMDNWELVKNEA